MGRYTNDMWERMTHEIKKVAKEMLEVSRGFGPMGKYLGARG